MNFEWIFSLAANGSYIYAGTGSSGIYISSNNGNNWYQSSLNNQQINSIVVDGLNIFAGTYNGVFVSNDNGSSWVLRNEGLNMLYPSILALSKANGYLFAGTIGYSVWKRSLSELERIRHISSDIPKNYNLSQNYPNPFNPITKIQYQLAKNSHVELKVFDVAGHQIALLVNEQQTPGTYEAEFDGSGYASGVYFYQITTESFTETKRMVMVK